MIKLSQEDQFLIRGLAKRKPYIVAANILKSVDKTYFDMHGKNLSGPSKEDYRRALRSAFTARVPDGAMKVLNEALERRWDRKRFKDMFAGNRPKKVDLPLNERVILHCTKIIRELMSICNYRKAVGIGGKHRVDVEFHEEDFGSCGGEKEKEYDHSVGWTRRNSVHTLYLNRKLWFKTVYHNSLAVVDDHFILDAQQEEEADCVQMYKVHYAKQNGHSFGIGMELGYVAKDTKTQQAALAPTPVGARRKLKNLNKSGDQEETSAA